MTTHETTDHEVRPVRDLRPGDVVRGSSLRGTVLALLDDPASRWSDILDASHDHEVETVTRQQDGSTLVHMVRGDGERTMLRPYDHDRTVEVQSVDRPGECFCDWCNMTDTPCHRSR